MKKYITLNENHRAKLRTSDGFMFIDFQARYCKWFWCDIPSILCKYAIQIDSHPKSKFENVRYFRLQNSLGSTYSLEIWHKEDFNFEVWLKLKFAKYLADLEKHRESDDVIKTIMQS